MLPVRSNLPSYLAGGIVAILGGLLLVLPSFVVAGVANDPTSPTDVPVLAAGAILGLPLVATGIVLTQKRYRITLYLALCTGIVYVAVPSAVSQSIGPLMVYLPAAIVFFAVFLALVFVATVRLSS